MRITDEQIVAALFASSSNKAAARELGITERQLYTRIRAPSFREQLAAAKAALLEHATSAAEKRLTAAVQTMTEVMIDRDNAPGVRVAAADALIRNTLKLIELNDVSRRLDELERLVADAEKER